MSKKVYIFLADGFEDIEGLTVVDLLRRAGHLWQGDRNTVLQAKPYGLFYFPYCPFPSFLPPLMCFFHSSI